MTALLGEQPGFAEHRLYQRLCEHFVQEIAQPASADVSARSARRWQLREGLKTHYRRAGKASGNAIIPSARCGWCGDGASGIQLEDQRYPRLLATSPEEKSYRRPKWSASSRRRGARQDPNTSSSRAPSAIGGRSFDAHGGARACLEAARRAVRRSAADRDNSRSRSAQDFRRQIPLLGQHGRGSSTPMKSAANSLDRLKDRGSSPAR